MELELSAKSPLLAAHNVCRSFNTSEGILDVLKGVNLEVNESNMVAVVGESGVGKSTLLHLLGGLDRPTKGMIAVKGESFADKSETELAQFRNGSIGFVFQHHYLLEDFTALENTMIPALISGKGKNEAADSAEQLLNLVGLANRRNHRPRQLSGGEQQRAAVARALANNPEIVMLDEPTGNLDIKAGEKLHKLLVDINKSHGVTFIIATHNLELAKMCRIIVKLEDGLVGETKLN